MSINRGVDKQDMVHTHNSTSLSHKKEWNGVTCRHMDGPRDCHTEWNKLGREKQISYKIASMCNLEKSYIWIYLQSRNRDADIKNKCMAIKVGVGGKDELGDWIRHISYCI